VIDFDDIDSWESQLAAALSPYVSDLARKKLASTTPEYVEDARDVLLNLSSRNAVMDATLNWIRSTNIACYHGTRLIDTEVSSIRTLGLIPLHAESRHHRLTRALSPHPDWHRVAHQLDAKIQAHGERNAAGHREGQVHLTLSRAGLTKSFNHYITHGSEFDQRVAYALLGVDGKQLLALDGKPTLIQVAIPGSIALDAAHPFFDVDYLRSTGEVPQIVDQFLQAWAFRLSYPEFQSRSLAIDCGMMFRSTVPANWIVNIETLTE
jgi:hypothetical protein